MVEVTHMFLQCTEHVKSIICLKCSCSDSLRDVRGLSDVRYMVWVQIAYAITCSL